ncbi:MAG: LEA type 2 family protein [Gammaproteobacteria bacterium]
MFNAPGIRLLGLLLLLLLASGCSLQQAPSQIPDIRIAGLSAESVGLDRQVFQLDLRLSNPNSAAIRVASGRLRLDLQDMSIGTAELVDGFSVPAGQEGLARLRVVTDLMTQAPRLLSGLMANQGSLKYRVSGYLDVIGFGLGRVPVDEVGSFSLRPPTPASSEVL